MTIKVKDTKTLIINVAIFILYLFASSLFLFNHSGGADIAFAVAIFFFLAIHLLVVIFIDIRKKKFLNSLTVIILLIFTITTIDYYLKFMWWLTHKI